MCLHAPIDRREPSMPRLQDKVALVTGGESGIGLATARLFVSEGARVHLIGIDEPKLASAVEELGEDHALSSVGDVSDEHAVIQAVGEGEDRYGRLDIVVSNAGISGEVSEIVDYPSDVFARTLAVHVLGAFHVLKHTIPRISDGGSIIITSSVVGLIGFGGLPAYVAAKHGQGGLMRAAAKEVAPPPLPGNTLHPGPPATALPDDNEMRPTGQPPAGAA